MERYKPIVGDPVLTDDKFEGVEDKPFREYLDFVDSSIVRLPEFEDSIDFTHTLRNIYAYFGSADIPEASKYQKMTSLIQDVKSAGMIDVNVVGARQTRKQLADEKTVYLAASFAYARKNRITSRGNPATIYNLIEDTKSLWGENQMSGYIDELSKSKAEEIEKVFDRRENEKRPDKTQEDKGEYTGSGKGPDDISMVVIEQADIEQIQRWYMLASNPMVNAFPRKGDSIDWQQSFVPMPVAKVVDFIRRANSQTLEPDQGNFQMTQEELKEGLIVVRGYLQKYRNIPNLKALHDAVRKMVDENPGIYTKRT